MYKKIKDLTKDEREEMNKIIDNCQIIAFDNKEIDEKILLAYNLRQAAHETLLESDKILDEVLKELRGIKTNANRSKDSKTKGVGKSVKNKKLGKKV